MSAGQLPLLGADGFRDVEVSWVLETRTLQGSTVLPSSCQAGQRAFVPLWRETVGLAEIWWESKTFSGIWRGGGGKENKTNKVKGICLQCNFIDMLNLLIPISRLQLIRSDPGLAGLVIFKKHFFQRNLYGVYIHIYIYICHDIFTVSHTFLTERNWNVWALRPYSSDIFIWDFTCPINSAKPLENTFFQ